MPTKDLSAYLFLGEEDFLKEEQINKLKSRFPNQQVRNLNYNVFYAKDKKFNLSEMLDVLNTLPFMSKKRVVVLKDADALSESQKKSTLFYLRNPRNTSIFVMESIAPVIKGNFLLEASKLAKLVYYRRLREADINPFLVKRLASYDKKITSEAIKAITEHIPNGLRALISCIDNIVLYVGKRNVVSKEDVEKIVGKSIAHTAFDLINSMEKKDVKKALSIFSSLKRGKKRETELLGLLSWNTRMLLRVKELLNIESPIEICKSIGLHPRKFKEILNLSRGFEKEKIQILLEEILQADLAIKRGSTAGIVMEKLIVRMCG